ncbi:MAG: class I tRNA ligase family protein, partial [Candidatus Dormibacteria bacterium]
FRGGSEEVSASCATLHRVLCQTARLMAPFTPFVAEAIFRELNPGDSPEPVSVHLEDYPEPSGEPLDHELLGQMQLVRRLAEDARALRERESVPLRQPLGSAQVEGAQLSAELAQVLADEINVGEVRCVANGHKGPATVSVDFHLTASLRREGLLRTFTRQFQNLRRKSGLKAGEPVALRYACDDELAAAIESGSEALQSQCFIRHLEREQPGSPPPDGQPGWTQLWVAPHPIWVALQRIGQDAQWSTWDPSQQPQDGP